MLRKSVLLLSSLFLISACANHHCRLKKEGSEMSDLSSEQSEKVLVAKPDGSKQCEEKSGVSLDEMAKELGEITVYRQFKKNDGMMRIQVCGAPTGNHNVYEISSGDRQKALDVGFKIWAGEGQR